jgi:hypothetical protein
MRIIQVDRSAGRNGQWEKVIDYKDGYQYEFGMWASGTGSAVGRAGNAL